MVFSTLLWLYLALLLPIAGINATSINPISNNPGTINRDHLTSESSTQNETALQTAYRTNQIPREFHHYAAWRRGLVCQQRHGYRHPDQPPCELDPCQDEYGNRLYNMTTACWMFWRNPSSAEMDAGHLTGLRHRWDSVRFEGDDVPSLECDAYDLHKAYDDFIRLMKSETEIPLDYVQWRYYMGHTWRPWGDPWLIRLAFGEDVPIEKQEEIRARVDERGNQTFKCNIDSAMEEYLRWKELVEIEAKYGEEPFIFIDWNEQ